MALPARNSTAIALAVLGLATLLVFERFFLGNLTLIGDSDRLNAFLSIRKFEVDGIQAWGRVPHWNERIFMGAGIAGLHYMVPGLGIPAYLEALLPVQYLFEAMTYATLLLVLAAGLTAYFFLWEVCRSRFASTVGAIAYCLSVYAIHRSAQLDSSLAILAHIPLGMLFVRRINRNRLAKPFLGLALTIASLVFFTFLQEAAYALVLFGLYSLHRAMMARSLWPIAVLLLSAFVAIGMASPRIVAVLEDFRQLDRTTDFQQTSWIEIYRFFAEGFFGRTQGEGRSLGNGTNLHEGLQLLGSTLASLLVVGGTLAARGWYERLGAFACLVALSMITGGPLYSIYLRIAARLGGYSTEFTVLLINLAVAIAIAGFVWIRRTKGGAKGNQNEASSFSQQTPASHLQLDAAFFYLVTAFVLCVVLVTEFRFLFYLAFFKVDFTHARFSIAALLPLCGLVAILLARLLDGDATRLARLTAVSVSLAGAGGMAVAWTIDSVPIDALADAIRMPPLPVAWNYALPVEVIRLVSWIVIVGFVTFVAIRRRHSTQQPMLALLGIALGCAVVAESVMYARFKISGPHTVAQESPFQDNSYMNVATKSLRPPATKAQAELGKYLQTSSYRSVFVAPTSQFPAYVAPHLANFWGMRVVDGYSAGVPRRLAALDWPGDVRNLRSISFSSLTQVPWELLAYLNVKFAVQVDHDFYFNQSTACLGAPLSCVPTPKVRENPFDPLPRHFLAANARPGGLPFASSDGASLPNRPQAVIATATRDREIALSWTATWGSDATFNVEMSNAMRNYRVVGQVGPSGRSFVSTNLEPGRTYHYRIQACRKGECSGYSDSVEIVAPSSRLPKPFALAFQALTSDSTQLTWETGALGLWSIVEKQAKHSVGFEVVARVPPGTQQVVLPVGTGDAPPTYRVRTCEGELCSVHSDTGTNLEFSTPASEGTQKLRLPIDLRETTFVEGLKASKVLSTEGRLDVSYLGDRIQVDVDPSSDERLVVLNEMYHPGWKAYANGAELRIYPVNTVMRGVFVPPGVSRVSLSFEPFLFTMTALVIILVGLGIGMIVYLTLARSETKGAVGEQAERS